MGSECDHKFMYQGVKFSVSDRFVPGSGARVRDYFDFYVCEKCLGGELRPLDCSDDTYQIVKFDATPVRSR
jgi:hypothetical protein